MSYSEVLYRLGDLLASQDNDRQEGTAYFEASIDADPQNGLALSALAVEKENIAEWAVAEDLYHRALRASPDDPTVLFRWGEFLGQRGGDYRDAVSALTRSTRLDPAFAPAWAALAEVYSKAGVVSPESLAAAETAHRLLPADDEVAGDLLRLLLRSDHRERALELVETSFRSRPRLRAQAWMMVLQHDFIRARELLRDGRPEEALRRIELAERIAAHGVDPTFIRQSIESLRRAVAENEASTLYARAEGLFAAGDLEGARTSLELALSKINDGMSSTIRSSTSPAGASSSRRRRHGRSSRTSTGCSPPTTSMAPSSTSRAYRNIPTPRESCGWLPRLGKSSAASTTATTSTPTIEPSICTTTRTMPAQ